MCMFPSRLIFRGGGRILPFLSLHLWANSKSVIIRALGRDCPPPPPGVRWLRASLTPPCRASTPSARAPLLHGPRAHVHLRDLTVFKRRLLKLFIGAYICEIATLCILENLQF